MDHVREEYLYHFDLQLYFPKKPILLIMLILLSIEGYITTPYSPLPIEVTVHKRNAKIPNELLNKLLSYCTTNINQVIGDIDKLTKRQHYLALSNDVIKRYEKN